MDSTLVEKFGLIGRVTTPGESLRLVDHNPPLPKEFSWASGNTEIARVSTFYA